MKKNRELDTAAKVYAESMRNRVSRDFARFMEEFLGSGYIRAYYENAASDFISAALRMIGDAYRAGHDAPKGKQ